MARAPGHHGPGERRTSSAPTIRPRPCAKGFPVWFRNGPRRSPFCCAGDRENEAFSGDRPATIISQPEPDSGVNPATAISLCPPPHLLSLLLVFAADTAPADPLRQALSVLEEEEPFTRFFATEKTGIRRPADPDYLEERNAYLLHCHTTGTREQSPAEALKRLERLTREQDLIVPGREEAVSDAFFLAGMELLTDRPAIPYEENGLRVSRGIVYAAQPNKKLELDLFRPEPPPGAATPCIICIHGGGFRVHRREWFAGHAAMFARAGFASVTIDYRKDPGIEHIGDPVHDAKAAVRWVRANARSYDIDPDRIGIFGGSAGGRLASVIATTGDHPMMEGEGGHEGVSSAVQAGVICAATSERLDRPEGRPPLGEETRAAIRNYGREVVALVCPYEQVDAGDPPLLLLHGSADKVVPPYQSKDLHQRYADEGLHVEMDLLEGAGHGFYLQPETVERAARFFRGQFGMGK